MQSRHWRWGLLGAAGLGLSYLTWQVVNAPNISLDLAQAPVRLERPVLAPEEPLARDESFPFCSQDWTKGMPSGSGLLAWLPLTSRLRFYVERLQPLEMTLVAHFKTGYSQPVKFLVNGKVWQEASLKQEWQTVTGLVPSDFLCLGRNELSFNMEVGMPIELKSFKVQPQQSLALTAFTQPDSDSYRLPWNADLAIPVYSTGFARLSMQALSTDCLPGVASPEGARLHLLYRAPGIEWDRTYTPQTTPLSITLPRSASGWGKLQLKAELGQVALPGQKGLILDKAELVTRKPWFAANKPGPSQAKAVADTLVKGRRPNVILYLIDTLRADHLGCYGHKPSPSPCLDKFAGDAVLFVDAMAQSSWTKPATASIMSSQWPWRHGVQDFIDVLPTGIPWLAQELHKAGYNTAGVCCNSLAGPQFGYDRGYDVFHEMKGGATSERAHQQVLEWFSKQRQQDKPFFLYIHTLDPHSPYRHSPRYQGFDESQTELSNLDVDKMAALARTMQSAEGMDPILKAQIEERKADYDHEIANNDKNFGLFMDWLKSQGLYQDALIIVVSDHGEEFLDHGQIGHINSLFQELLHVPLIIKFPQGQGAGQQVRQIWQQIDIAPTILNQCQVAIPQSFQGQAYVPQALQQQQRPCLFSVQAGRRISAQAGKEALFVSLHGIRQDKWVYQRVISGMPGRFEPEMLFDLSKDPEQRHNLAYSDPGHSLSLSIGLESLFESRQQASESKPIENKQLMELLRSLQYVR